MPSLKSIQAVIPSACSIVGRVQAFHEGKHVDLGAYVGDDAVALNAEGDAIMAAAAQAVEAEKEAVAAAVLAEAKPEKKSHKKKPVEPKPAADADFANLGDFLSNDDLGSDE